MGISTKKLFEKAVEISGLEAQEFKKLSEEDRQAFMDQAKGLLVDDQSNEQPEKIIDLVKMTRDQELYPEPHTCEVHPDEVGNYALGGWVHAE